MTAPAPARRAPSVAEHVRINGEQRVALQGAALAGVRSLLRSASILLGAAASPGEPDPHGLLTASGALYTYAVEEYGKLLLIESLPEKGGIVSVPYREIFRSHGKKFKAALGTLPAECGQLARGIFDPRIFDPRIFDAEMTEATFFTRMSLLYTDIGRSGRPSTPRRLDAKLLRKALQGLEQAVAEWEACNRREAP